VPEFLRSLALESREAGRQHIVHLWSEQRALEAVRDELAAEFDGIDPLLPEHRERAEETDARLRSLATALGARKPLKNRDDELASHYRKLVHDGFKSLGLAEPFQ